MNPGRALLPAVVALLWACGTDVAYPYYGWEPAPDAGGDGSGADADEDVDEDIGDDVAEDADAATDGDTGEDAPVGARLGAACMRNTDCNSGICVPVGGGRNVCSESCAIADCVGGWTCDPGSNVCLCSAADETCDGMDNDCDGLSDEGTGAAVGCDPSEVCRDATCVCEGGDCGCADGLEACPDGCVDTWADRDNCGACGRSCDPDEVCSDGDCTCACPDGACETGTCYALPFGGAPAAHGWSFSPDPQQVDVVLNVDTTGSMGGQLSALKTSLTTAIIPGVADLFADPAFAITTFEDFPCGDYGSSGDLPFQLHQRVTTSASTAQSRINAVSLGSGADQPESGFESLFQIVTGTGRTGCGAIPTFDPDANRIPGVADGVLGGVGFRDGSLPVVVHVTDALSHARGEAGYPYGATRAEALDAMSTFGARFVGVSSSSDARSDLTQVATETGSTVPPCAWGEAATRPSGCAADACCTGSAGAGRASVGGRCALVFDVSASGTGLDRSVLSGMAALARFATSDLRIRVVRDAETYDARGIDTSCLVQGARVRSAAVTDTCAPAPTAEDTDGDGIAETVLGATAATSVTYEITLDNDCIATPGVYRVDIDVMSSESTRHATRALYVVVPGD